MKWWPMAAGSPPMTCSFIPLFLFISSTLQRGREGEKESKRQTLMWEEEKKSVASCKHPDQTRHLGTCPHWESSLLVNRQTLLPTEPPSQGPCLSLTVATEGVPGAGQVSVLHRALLLLGSLAWGGGAALHVGGAEPLLRLLGVGAQGLPSHLERERKQG